MSEPLATVKILVVDDEPQIRELVRSYLQRDGYDVVEAGTGPEAVSVAESEHPNLVLLDLMLPGLNGFDVCRRLREISNVPIIMLTARDEETDKIVGLELGADDYITKPFSPREVVARVKAVLRRVSSLPKVEEVFRIGDLEIDRSRHEVRLTERLVQLTPTEFKLLDILASNPGRVFTRLQLIEKVQGYSFEGYERTIDAHIKNLRQKLQVDSETPQYITTVYGVGYRFEG